MLSEQVSGDHGASMLNGEQVNDHIEEDDHTNKLVEDDGTNTLIHENIDEFDYFHDVPLLDKEYKPLYEGSKTNILSFILLIMNLKVMNGLSNISITGMLRYIK